MDKHLLMFYCINIYDYPDWVLHSYLLEIGYTVVINFKFFMKVFSY